MYDNLFSICYEAWFLALVERDETLKLSIYFLFACVRGVPAQPALAIRLCYALTKEEPVEVSTPRSRKVGTRVPCHSIPRELQNMAGVAVDAARRAGMIQEPAFLLPGRHIS